MTIPLPEIAGIAGAVYDTQKPHTEQATDAWNWGLAVMAGIPHSEALSRKQVFGNRYRYTMKVWEYGGLRLMQQIRFSHPIHSGSYLAISNLTIKIEQA